MTEVVSIFKAFRKVECKPWETNNIYMVQIWSYKFKEKKKPQTKHANVLIGNMVGKHTVILKATKHCQTLLTECLSNVFSLHFFLNFTTLDVFHTVCRYVLNFHNSNVWKPKQKMIKRHRPARILQHSVVIEMLDNTCIL